MSADDPLAIRVTTVFLRSIICLMRFIPNNERVRREMLAEMGLSGIDDLFASIPQRYRLQEGLNIADGQSEAEHLALFDELAGRNLGADCLSFLGAGAYDHFSPLVVDALLQRAEFFTSYTPYQPEVSQGTLQAIFEFQTFMCCLTGMDVANASVYDGASAAAEAVLMADRLQKRRRRVLLPLSLHPHYRAVVETYCAHLELTLETVPTDPVTGRMDLGSLEAQLDEDVACVVVQQPNFYGVVEDLSAIANFVQGWDSVVAGRRGDAREIDLTVDYRIGSGRLESLWLRLRASWLEEDVAPHSGTDFRVILRYELPVI